MINLLLVIIYLSFISLGLPDALLGSAWPVMSVEFGASISSMGIVSIIISAGTIISSLQSNRFIQKYGVYKITVVSVATTAISLFGFACSPSFIVLCLWAVPYGLGAGSVDAALNNYVAVHFESKHMSWLHCMWGIGATIGPSIMGMALVNNLQFRGGYGIVFALQGVLAIVILASKSVWKTEDTVEESVDNSNAPVPSLIEIFKIKGVPQIAIAFFCFCAIEQTVGLWASSYLVYNRGVEAEKAAGFTALYYLGITVGRGINGFIAMKYSDKQLIRVGSGIMAVGIAILMLPFGGAMTAFIGLSFIGLGSAPVFPCIIHSTPDNFGVDNSQAITGVQMASAYLGALSIPALFGLVGNYISFSIYPFYVAIMLACMVFMYEQLLKKLKK